MMCKKKQVICTVVCVLAVLCALVGCGQSESKTEQPNAAQTTPSAEMKLVTPGKLTLASDFAFPPFEYMDNNTKAGFSVELAEALGKEMGLEVVWIEPLKFDTLIPLVAQGGKIDAAFASFTITDERLQEVDFTDPYLDSNQALCVMDGSLDKAALNAGDKKIAVQSGTSGEAWARENLTHAQVVAFDDTTGAFGALTAGQVDAVVNDLPVTQWLVKQSYPQVIIKEEIPTGEQYGIPVSKQNPQLTAQLNSALKKLKENGEYQKIYDKYFK